MEADVLIVGAGHAGGQVAIALRERGFGGSILIVGDELSIPYERPPLSKAYFAGTVQIDRLHLRASDFWAAQNVQFELGQAVTELDGDRRDARLADGRSITYKWCVLATGGRVRRLDRPGADLPGVHYLRTFQDVDAIRRSLAPQSRIAVVGAGYVGLEVAAAARELGHDVTVVESQSRVLARVTSPVVSRFFETQHRARGVDIRLDEGVSAIVGTDRVEKVRLLSGADIPADLVIVGIGIDPNSGLAEQAGARCDGGVLVDESCRTTVPFLLAVGDCARHPNDFAGGMYRLESVQHALGSANVAAGVIMGETRAYCELPWFWSDQYDIRLQTAGLSIGADEIVVRGNTDKPPFAVAYLREGRLVAVDAINCPKDFMAARALILAGATPDRDLLADTAVPLRAVHREIVSAA